MEMGRLTPHFLWTIKIDDCFIYCPISASILAFSSLMRISLAIFSLMSAWIIIKYDTTGIFKFASLQSETAKQMLAPYGLDADKLSSVFLLENGRVYHKSSAVLQIAKQLKSFWPLYLLIIIPKFIRDWLYDLMAKSRYRIWGKREACMLPTPEIGDRFIAPEEV